MLSDFEYVVPDNIADMCDVLKQYGAEARVLAGGTDLLVQMKRKGVQLGYLVTGRSLGLNYITDGPQGLRIGAFVTLSEIERSGLVRQKYPIILDAVMKMASPQVRNLATIGGNLCNAAPSADLAPPLLALDAEVTVFSQSGERRLQLEDFFLGPGLTALTNGEILSEIRVPQLPPTWGGAYLKQQRTAEDIAIVGVAASMLISHNGCASNVRIALGAVGPTPVRAVKAEAFLEGQLINEEKFKRAGEIAREECTPIDDVRASAMYRKRVVEVLTKRALKEAASRSLALSS